MKHIHVLFLLAFPLVSFSQDPSLAPFYHGVASGDALSDRVIIWTRISDATGTVSAGWKMATDSAFCNVVQTGTASTDSSKDYTIKVDVIGLQPDTWYYYQFTSSGKNSLIGRTKTLPVGDNQRIRLGVVSCSNYESGTYYNAYLSLARRNDIHAVVHLGDYIYEYAQGGTSGLGIRVLPANELLTLDDYRQRYNSYRLDPYLRFIHQQYPFYTVWDDHETANNSWEGGAQNHTPGTEGDWQTRKGYGKQANFEWLPKRERAPGDYTIYRTFHIGNLADLILLDTRLEGRSEQVALNDQAGLQDPNRTILGNAQMQWFQSQLSSSNATWKIVGQQVMIAPLKVAGIIVNADQWDGYQADRDRIINYVLDSNVQNVVFLTGDIHSSWASDIPGPGYNAATGAGSAFVEYVTTSITSGSSPVPLDPRPFNPHIKFAELTQRGYFILDIDAGRAQADWVFVSSITDASFTESDAGSWYVSAGTRFLKAAAAPASGYTNPAPFAPSSTETMICSGIETMPHKITIGVYPNPFFESFSLELKGISTSSLHIALHNLLGKKVFETEVSGFHPSAIDASGLPAGSYLMTAESGAARLRTAVVKMH